jgi:hypothetical protein
MSKSSTLSMIAQALLSGSFTTWLAVKVASSKKVVTCGRGARPCRASSTVDWASRSAESRVSPVMRMYR